MQYCHLVLFLAFQTAYLSAQITVLPIDWLSANSARFSLAPDHKMWVMLQHHASNQANARLAVHHFEADGQWTGSFELEDRFLNSFDLITLPSGALVAAVKEADGSDNTVALLTFSPDHTLTQYQRLRFPYLSLGLNGLINTPDGYLLTVCERTAPLRIHLLKFSLNGIMQWEKTIFGDLSGVKAMVDADGNIYQFISASIGTGIARLPKLLKLNHQGDLLQAWAIHGGDGPAVYSVCQTSDHHFILAGRTADNSDTYPDYWILKMDTNAQVKWSYQLANQGSEQAFSYYYRLQPDNDKGFYWQIDRQFSQSPRSILCHFDENGQMRWGKTLPGANILFDMAFTGEALYSLGNDSGVGSNSRLMVFQMDAAGNLPSCCTDSIALVPREQAAFTQPIPLYPTGNGVVITVETMPLTEFTPLIEKRCEPLAIRVDPAVICPNECVQVSLLNTNADTISVNWTFSGGQPAGSQGIVSIPICYEKPGKYPVDALVDVGNNCLIPLQDSINLCTPDFIPNAFSPNGDAVNDVFKPVLYFPVKDFLFEIYNRWGQLVFASHDPLVGWNGQIAGQDAPSDVYIWTLRFTNIRQELEEEKSIKGEITLLR